MKQTQINGSTFVNANDVAQWIRQNGNQITTQATTDEERALAEAVKKTANYIATALEDWADDPRRKIGVTNVKMDVI